MIRWHGLLAACGTLALLAARVSAQMPGQLPPEPPAPAAGPAVQALLDEAARLANKPAEALVVADRSLAVAREGIDLPGLAGAHRMRALRLEDLKKPDEAKSAWEAAGVAWKAVGDGPGQLEALVRGALLAPDAARRDAGIDAAIALATAEARRPLAAAAALHDAGEHANDLNLPGPARRLVEAALARRAALAPGSIALADSLSLLGYLTYARRDPVGAKRYWEQALAIFEKLAPGSLNLARSTTPGVPKSSAASTGRTGCGCVEPSRRTARHWLPMTGRASALTAPC